MTICSYCGGPILGEAEMLPDCSASGVSLPVYWHADKDECGPRSRRGAEAATTSRGPVTVAMREWRSRQSDS